MRTTEAARGKWFGILTSLGVGERFLRNTGGPCPICGGTDRFRFDNKDQRGTWYCNNCEPRSGDGMSLAMNFTGLGFKELAQRIDQMVGNISADTNQQSKPRTDPRARLNAISKRLQPCKTRNPVTDYLMNRNVAFSDSVRFSPSEKYFEQGKVVGTFPAMVNKVFDKDGNPASLHLTYLTKDGSKASVKSPKKLMPPTRDWTGGAIRLFPECPTLGIAEGVETALAATKLFGVYTWSAVSSTRLEQFIPPEIVQELHIFSDNDESFEGQRAAFTLASRLKKTRNINVIIHCPDQVGTDYADIIKGIS